MSNRRCLLFFAVCGGAFRRWFGGGFGKFGAVSRFWKYLVITGLVLLMYSAKGILDWRSWRMYATIVSFMWFWSCSHGAWFIYWDHSDAAEGRKPLLDKWLWFLVGIDKSRTFWGYCLGMFNRYEMTAIVVALCIPSWWFLLAGGLVALAYVPAGLKQDTRIGEVLAGALVFPLLYLCI